MSFQLDRPFCHKTHTLYSLIYYSQGIFDVKQLNYFHIFVRNKQQNIPPKKGQKRTSLFNIFTHYFVKLSHAATIKYVFRRRVSLPENLNILRIPSRFHLRTASHSQTQRLHHIPSLIRDMRDSPYIMLSIKHMQDIDLYEFLCLYLSFYINVICWLKFNVMR